MLRASNELSFQNLMNITCKTYRHFNFIAHHSKQVHSHWQNSFKMYRILEQDMNVQTEYSGIQIVEQNIKCTREVYFYLRDKMKVDNTKMRNNWESLLNIEISDEDWRKLFVDISKLTNSTKLRFFHYRIINGYLITNIRVAKWDREVSPLCSFCKATDETVIHLLVLCPKVRKIWNVLKKWLYYFCNIKLEIETEQIVLNRYKESFQRMVNTIILIVKYYIYVQKVAGNHLSFLDVVKYIEKYKRIEYLIARRSNTVKKHDKWLMYKV